MSVGLGLPESDVTVESCNSQNWAFGYGRTGLREIRCPNLARPKRDARRERERDRKLAKRQKVAEAKQIGSP